MIDVFSVIAIARPLLSSASLVLVKRTSNCSPKIKCTCIIFSTKQLSSSSPTWCRSYFITSAISVMTSAFQTILPAATSHYIVV